MICKGVAQHAEHPHGLALDALFTLPCEPGKPGKAFSVLQGFCRHARSMTTPPFVLRFPPLARWAGRMLLLHILHFAHRSRNRNRLYNYVYIALRSRSLGLSDTTQASEGPNNPPAG